MTDLDVDLSFLNYRDEEDTTRDAGVYWKYYTRKHHCPVFENMVEWSKTTDAVPKNIRKPQFSHLPEFKKKLAAKALADENLAKQKFGLIYKEKKMQREAIEQWRAQRRKELQKCHERAWNQKEKRDCAIKKIKDGYYWAKTKINKADYVNLFLNLAPSDKVDYDPKMFEEKEVLRAKTEQEMYQDIMDTNYAECGDEACSRRDAEIFLALDLGLNPFKIDLTAPATARGTKEENFAEAAFNKDKLETIVLPKKDKTEAELQVEWGAETEVHFDEEQKKFSEKEWLEDIKPARVGDVSDEPTKPESFDVFQIMSAWVKKHNHSVKREEMEALENVQQVGQGQFLSPRPGEKLERDEMLIQYEQWRQEDLLQEQTKFCEQFRDLEQRYNIYIWLLSVSVVKDFILQNKRLLVLQPKYDVQETVTQVEIITHVYMNPEFTKEKVEEYAEEFLNSWIRLQDYDDAERSLDDYKEVLVQEFIQKAVELVKENYPLLGSWAQVRKLNSAVMKMVSKRPPEFNLSTNLLSIIKNGQ